MINGPRLFRQLVRAGLTAAVPNARFVTRLSRNSGALFLTFDDGPHPEYTPRILDTLASHSARATFFVVGQEARQNTQLVRRIVAEGHTLGSHTYSHPRPQTLSLHDFRREMNDTQRLLEDVTGIEVRLYRPPYGKVTARQFVDLWSTNCRIALWNQDPRDYAAPCPDALVRWFDSSKLLSGDVVLLHDNQSITADGLNDCLRSLPRELQLRTLDESDIR